MGKTDMGGRSVASNGEFKNCGRFLYSRMGVYHLTNFGLILVGPDFINTQSLTRLSACTTKRPARYPHPLSHDHEYYESITPYHDNITIYDEVNLSTPNPYVSSDQHVDTLLNELHPTCDNNSLRQLLPYLYLMDTRQGESLVDAWLSPVIEKTRNYRQRECGD